MGKINDYSLLQSIDGNENGRLVIETSEGTRTTTPSQITGNVERKIIELEEQMEDFDFGNAVPLSVEKDADGNIVIKGNAITMYSEDEPSSPSIPEQTPVTVDSFLSDTSENPVENKVITEALRRKYEKPAAGIQEEDLSSEVREKLKSTQNGGSYVLTDDDKKAIANLVNKETGSGNVPTASLEDFGGIANSNTTASREKNRKALEDAIKAGYNIKCLGGNLNAGNAPIYYFSGVVDVRTVSYKSIDINLNGCRFMDFHIITNLVDDSAMTSTSVTWRWNNGNKYYLSIHDGLIGGTQAGEMAYLPKQPIAITGHIPRFYNLQVIGFCRLCAMPPVYCDQMTFRNIKWVFGTTGYDTYYNDLDMVCMIYGHDSSGYLYCNNGDKVTASGSGCIRGDQFFFEELNDCRRFFTICYSLGTIVKDCISSGFGIVSSTVKMINMHNESSAYICPPVYKFEGNSWTDLTFEKGYMEQNAFIFFSNLTKEQASRIKMIDTMIRIGHINDANNHDIVVPANYLETLYKMKEQRGNKVVMWGSFVGQKAIIPCDLYCMPTATPSASSTLSSNTAGNQTVGAYTYSIHYHASPSLQVAQKSESKSVTFTEQHSINTFTVSDYAGQMISIYKTVGGNKYRAIIKGHPVTASCTLNIVDCGCYLVVYNGTTRNTPTGAESINEVVLWESVTSVPTVTVNANVKTYGSMIYDSTKKYVTNGLTLQEVS